MRKNDFFSFILRIENVNNVAEKNNALLNALAYPNTRPIIISNLLLLIYFYQFWEFYILLLHHSVIL